MRVRVRQLGGGDPRYTDVPDGSTVQQVLNSLSIPTTGISVTVNSANSTLDSIVSHHDTIMVATKVAGGLN